jgi:hypothetical protein
MGPAQSRAEATTIFGPDLSRSLRPVIAANYWHPRGGIPINVFWETGTLPTNVWLTLYRGSGNGLAPILLVAAEDASPESLKRLRHEYALKAELDAAWAGCRTKPRTL